MKVQRRSEKLNSFRSSSAACCKLPPSKSATEKALTSLGGHSKDHLVLHRLPRLSPLQRSSNFLLTNYDHERLVLATKQLDNKWAGIIVYRSSHRYRVIYNMDPQTKVFDTCPCRCKFQAIYPHGQNTDIRTLTISSFRGSKWTATMGSRLPVLLTTNPLFDPIILVIASELWLDLSLSPESCSMVTLSDFGVVWGDTANRNDIAWPSLKAFWNDFIDHGSIFVYICERRDNIGIDGWEKQVSWKSAFETSKPISTVVAMNESHTRHI